MSDEIELSIGVPLDEDGFLRRECPTCEREFKWKPATDDDEVTPAPEGGYHCPYCAVQAPSDSWWTKDQIEAAKATAFEEVLKPQLETIGNSGFDSDLLKVEVSVPDGPEKPTLTEVDDMKLIGFGCHPDEPVKVNEDWLRPIHCLICGRTAGSVPN